MDERRFREKTNEWLREGGHEPATSVEWEQAWARYASDFSREEVEDFAGLASDWIVSARKLMQASGVVARRQRRQTHAQHIVGPPEWWEAEFNRRAAEQYGGRKARVKELLGIDPAHPLTDFGEAQEMLFKHLAEQEATGRDLWLQIFVPSRDEDVDWDAKLFQVFSGEARGEQPLYALQHLAEQMSAELHCDEVLATAWVLVDEPLQPTWLEVDGDVPVWDEFTGSTPMVDEAYFTIRIGSPMVAPTDVAKAYADARRKFFGDVGDKRAPRLWPVRVRAFMADWEAEQGSKKWKDAFAEFNRRYSDSPYKTMRTFRNAYYERRGKENQA